jgi:hypothetical protein
MDPPPPPQESQAQQRLRLRRQTLAMQRKKKVLKDVPTTPARSEREVRDMALVHAQQLMEMKDPLQLGMAFYTMGHENFGRLLQLLPAEEAQVLLARVKQATASIEQKIVEQQQGQQQGQQPQQGEQAPQATRKKKRRNKKKKRQNKAKALPDDDPQFAHLTPL